MAECKAKINNSSYNVSSRAKVANYTHNSLHYFYTVQILCVILNSQDHCQNNSLTLEI